tara:strand:+ start:511 stop:888 length:378 start_codon:yes stop_codon:yes gene_type:complete
MKQIKLITLIIISLLIYNLSYASPNNDLENKIFKNLRCLICQGQSVYDSQSDFAESMKIVIREKLGEGMSEDQIYFYLKEKYGAWLLYDPELNKNTFLLWSIPLALFLLGGALILRKFVVLKKTQ